MKRNLRLNPHLLSWLVVVSTVGPCLAGDQAWPQWRGPRRDGISRETGLLKQWPEGGPKLLWSASGCGKGYSSVAVTEALIYTAGTKEEQTSVLAFDLTGKLKWSAPNGKPWKAAPDMVWAKTYDGARATPTADGGLVYHLNEMGQLSAFDAQSGKVVWSLDVLEKFGAKCPRYGYAESVLVDGDRLICTPGGAQGFMVALDKKTGSTVWVNTEISEGAGFASPILVEDHGIRQIITLSEEAIVGVDASTGKLLWRHPFTNQRKNNIPTPIYHNGFVFGSTGYGAGSLHVRRVWT